MTDETYDLIGNRYTGSVRITLRPGFGVRIDGQHVEGGPHYVPINIAAHLIQDGKAYPSPEEQAPEFDEAEARAFMDEQVEHADPVVENSDPKPRRKR